jgi:hypothetical protein
MISQALIDPTAASIARSPPFPSLPLTAVYVSPSQKHLAFHNPLPLAKSIRPGRSKHPRSHPPRSNHYKPWIARAYNRPISAVPEPPTFRI